MSGATLRRLAADASQAVYFRELLVDQREEMVSLVARSRRLDAQAHQLLFGAALHEQRHEVPDRVSVELRVSLMDDRDNGIRRHVWVYIPQPVDHLFDGRPFSCTDLTRNRHLANFAIRLLNSKQLSTSA